MRCVSLGFCDTPLVFLFDIFFIGKQNIKHVKTLGIEITAKMDDGIPGHSLLQASHHLFSPMLQGLCLSLFGHTEIPQSWPIQATNHFNLSCIEVLIQFTTPFTRSSFLAFLSVSFTLGPPRFWYKRVFSILSLGWVSESRNFKGFFFHPLFGCWGNVGKG